MNVDGVINSKKSGIGSITQYTKEEAVTQGYAVSCQDNGYGVTEISKSNSIDMSQTIYGKNSGRQEDTVVDKLENQASVDSKTRQDQMVVLSNTMSDEDYRKIQEEGFSLTESDVQTIITETDKIKAVLARAGVDISIYGDDLSQEQLSEILGSEVVARQIADSLASADLPLTGDNMDNCLDTYEKASSIESLDKSTVAYMLKNNMEPSVSNIYMAVHSSNYGYKSDVISDESFEQIREQINNLLEDCGLEINSENQNNCKWMIENNIPLTAENLKYATDLLAFDKADIFGAMADAIKGGQAPENAIILKGYSDYDIAKNACDVVENATIEDVAKVVQADEPLTVENLEKASKSSINIEIEFTSIEVITAHRKLEETRLSMTIQANISLLKKGISIDTKPLEDLIEDLKNQENDYYNELFSNQGVESTEENVSSYRAAVSCFEEMKYQPAYILDLNSSETIVSGLYDAGAKLKSTFDQASRRYETLWTGVRSDLGDSLKKAFGNIDDILSDLGKYASEENRRAVRILAYNETEISESNIDRIKAVDEEVQKCFKNMTPAVTLEMIRKGISPMNLTISELNQAATEIKEELGDFEQERFSKYLWKLEQNKEISEEERSSYIGIYRLISQVEKSDGAVIGSLINQGAEITMKNLLSAVRTARKGGMDYSIDDEFGGVEAKASGIKIDSQIAASYNQNCISDVLNEITPEKMQNIRNWEKMTPEQLRDELRNTEESDDEYVREQVQILSQASQVTENVYSFLDRYDLKTSVSNLMAASGMIKNPGQVVEKLWDRGKQGDSRQLEEQILEKFAESINSPEKLAEAQEELAETAEHVMDGMIIEDKSVTSLDIREMQQICKQLSIASSMAKEESYLIPIKTQAGITGVSLKIIRGEQNKGSVDIFMKGKYEGKIAASFEMKNNRISGLIATNDKEDTDILTEKVQDMISKLKASDGNQSEVDIKLVYTEELSYENFESMSREKESTIKEDNEISTGRLYGIAESFINSINEIMY